MRRGLGAVLEPLGAVLEPLVVPPALRGTEEAAGEEDAALSPLSHQVSPYLPPFPSHFLPSLGFVFISLPSGESRHPPEPTGGFLELQRPGSHRPFPGKVSAHPRPVHPLAAPPGWSPPHQGVLEGFWWREGCFILLFSIKPLLTALLSPPGWGAMGRGLRGGEGTQVGVPSVGWGIWAPPSFPPLCPLHLPPQPELQCLIPEMLRLVQGMLILLPGPR